MTGQLADFHSNQTRDVAEQIRTEASKNRTTRTRNHSAPAEQEVAAIADDHLESADSLLEVLEDIDFEIESDSEPGSESDNEGESDNGNGDSLTATGRDPAEKEEETWEEKVVKYFEAMNADLESDDGGEASHAAAGFSTDRPAAPAAGLAPGSGGAEAEAEAENENNNLGAHASVHPEPANPAPAPAFRSASGKPRAKPSKPVAQRQALEGLAVRRDVDRDPVSWIKYKRQCSDFYIKCPLHEGCSKTRSAKENVRNKNQGRPLGFLGQWALEAEKYDSKEDHQSQCLPDRASRLAVRNRLKLESNQEEFFPLERRKRVADGEGSEPEACP